MIQHFKKGLSALVAAVMFLNLAPAWAFTGVYEENIKLGEQSMAHFKVWTKDGLIRMQNLSSPETEITLKNAKGTFRYLPDRQSAMKLPDEKERQDLLNDLEDYPAFLKKQKAVRTDTQQYNGTACEIYEFTDAQTRFRNRVWMSLETNLPLFIEMVMPNGKMTVELTYEQIGGTLSDDLFDFPEDVKVTDLGALYRNMEGKPAQV